MKYREAKKVVTLRLSKQDEDIIKVLAKNDNLSKSAWIRRQLFNKISAYEKQKIPSYQNGV